MYRVTRHFAKHTVFAAGGLVTVKLTARDGKVFASSREVAKIFDKRHDHVLRDIDVLLSSPDLGSQQNQGVKLFFPMSSFDERANKVVRYFEMTRDGFTLLAMGYDGKNAMKFKLAYIAEFNRMEEALRAAPAPAPMTREQLIAQTRSLKSYLLLFRSKLYVLRRT